MILGRGWSTGQSVRPFRLVATYVIHKGVGNLQCFITSYARQGVGKVTIRSKLASVSLPPEITDFSTAFAVGSVGRWTGREAAITRPPRRSAARVPRRRSGAIRT